MRFPGNRQRSAQRMSILRAFRPTKWKTIAVAIFGVAWFLVLWIGGSVRCDCLPGGFEGCTDYRAWSLIELGCHCGCWSLGRAMTNNLVLLGPPCAAYVVLSLIQWLIGRWRASHRRLDGA